MASTFRNFIISFILAAVIFGVVAVFAVRIIDDQVLNPDLSNIDNKNPNALPTVPLTDDGGDNYISGSGETFGVLFMLNDYRPDVYIDYTVPDNTLGVPRRKNLENLVYMLFSKEKNEVVITSFDTKTRVSVDGIDMTVSAAYNYKGAEYVTKLVSKMSGIGIDYYVDFGIKALVETVDYLGKVTYTLPFDIQYTNEYEEIDVTIGRGKRALDGQQSMALLRFDSYSDPNGKLKTAEGFLDSAIHSFAGNYLNKVNFNTILSFISSKCDTNITDEQFAENIDLLFRAGNMTTTIIDFPGKYNEEFFIPDKDDGRACFDNYR